MSTTATALFLLSILCSAVATGWSMARPTYGQAPFTLEYLAQQARPLEKHRMILSFLSAALAVVALLWFFFDDPKAMRPILGVVTVVILLLSQFVQHYFQRVRALEEIIKRSLPDLYSEIRRGKD